MARSIKMIAGTLACLCTVLPIRSERTRPKDSDRMGAVPSLVLWAWERPEDLRFIDPDRTAVAFLASTVYLHPGGAIVRPRFEPLQVPDQTKLIAVVRIEAPAGAALSHDQIGDSVAAILRPASLPRVVAIQVDFDAMRSQRDFYRRLLLELRQRLSPALPISLTALASWCLDDDWISTLPIDEAVPMLFRMGAGTNDVVGQLTSGRDFRPTICQGSLGISTDERWAALPSGRRLYVFQTRSWTEQSELAFLREVRKWH